jgi:hypothetical protein
MYDEELSNQGELLSFNFQCITVLCALTKHLPKRHCMFAKATFRWLYL